MRQRIKFTDERVCKSHLLDSCPHDILSGTVSIIFIHTHTQLCTESIIIYHIHCSQKVLAWLLPLVLGLHQRSHLYCVSRIGLIFFFIQSSQAAFRLTPIQMLHYLRIRLKAESPESEVAGWLQYRPDIASQGAVLSADVWVMDFRQILPVNF